MQNLKEKFTSKNVKGSSLGKKKTFIKWKIWIYKKERKTTKIVTMWVHKNVEVLHMTTIAQNQDENKKQKLGSIML